MPFLFYNKYLHQRDITMKLNIFNPWKNLGALAGKTLQYQTSKVKGGSSYVTYIRDRESEQLITKGYGLDDDKSQKAAYDNLKRIGVEGLLKAIETKEPVMPTTFGGQGQDPDKKIEWRDGIGHSYKAQKRIVGEALDIQLDESLSPSLRLLIEEDMEKCKKNPVAKNMNKFNKPATHADKKNDYKRKPKNKKEVERSVEEFL